MTEQHSWHDDTPATDEQIETIRRDLDGGPGVGGAAFSRHAVRKLLAAYDEIHLDRAVLKATNTALETRAKKAEAELTDARDANALLRDGSKKLRAELDKCAGLNRSLVNEAADAETALAEVRERIGEAIPEYGLQYGVMEPMVLREQDEVEYYKQRRHVGLRVRDVYATAWREVDTHSCDNCEGVDPGSCMTRGTADDV